MSTKVTEIVKHIEGMIENELLAKGDQIPSLTSMMKEHKVSRDTVVRAYRILNTRGIIGAIHGKGYFVTNQNSNVEKNVFLLLDELSPYKNTLVKSIAEQLMEKGQYQIFFHHYNEKMFYKLVEEHKGQYTHYAISPFPESDLVCKAIELLPENRLILLDRHDGLDSKWRFIGQEYLKDITKCLNQLKEKIVKYRRFIFVFPEPSHHPKELKIGFDSFCKTVGIEGQIISDISKYSLKKGDACLVIEDTDLAFLVNASKKENWKLGRDVGILTYNDAPLKTVVADGITTISTDFGQMGKNLVKMIFDQSIDSIHNPVKLSMRNSF